MVTAVSEFDAKQALGDANPVCAATAASDNVPHKSAAAIVDLLDRMLAGSEPETVLVQELETYLPGQRVLLGLASLDGIDCRLKAQTTHWNASERSAIESAMQECLARGESGMWPPPVNSPRHALKAHEALAMATGSECLFTLPLWDRTGTVQGVLLVLGEKTFASDREAQALLHAAAQPIASGLSLLKQARLGTIRRWMNRAADLVRSRKLIAALAGLAAIAGAMFVPMTYRIACDCRLEPVTRRFVAAPFDGTLERSLVEPGDLVAEGQILAVMDGREIRWELAGLIAEQGQAKKERDRHMAGHDFGAAQVAKLEIERLGLREELLARRIEHLDIKSPIPGIVVAGDLKKSEGVPLAVGERLFEIAPLERMVVEVAVPESDVPWVKEGQTVEIVLDAWPETPWTGQLSRVHPRAELRDEEHVFIAEVLLENPEALLRPGMRGRAKIEGPAKPLGWNLFHKPWYELRYWLGW